MARRITALLTACIAAPYLAILSMFVVALATGGEPGVATPLDLLKVLPIGTMALLILGLPLICAATVLAIVLHLCHWEARWHIVLTAGLLGALFVGLALADTLAGSVPALLEGGVAGAICGWIYWRIALGRAGQST